MADDPQAGAIPNFDDLPEQPAEATALPNFDDMPDHSLTPHQRYRTVQKQSLAGSPELPAGWDMSQHPAPPEWPAAPTGAQLAHEWGQAAIGVPEGAAGSLAGGVLGDIEATGRAVAKPFGVSQDTVIPTSMEGGYLGKKGLDLIDPSANPDRAVGAMLGAALAGSKIIPPVARTVAKIPGKFIAPEEPPPPPPPSGPDLTVPRIKNGQRQSPPLLPPEFPTAPTAELPTPAAAGAEAVSPLENVAPEAVQVIHKLMKEDAGLTPDTLEQRLEEMSPHHFGYEIAPPLWNAAEGAVVDGGQGAMDITQSARQRVAEAPQRVSQIFDTSMGAKQDLSTIARVERAEQMKAADPAYQAFKDQKVYPTPELKDVMQDLQNVPGIFGRAKLLAALRRVPFDQSFFTTGEQKNFPTAASWDIIKRSLDNKIQNSYRAVEGSPVPRATDLTREYVKIRNKLVDAIDNHPDPNVRGVWKTARDIYAGPEKIREARVFGQRLINDNVDLDEIPYTTAKWGEGEMAAMREGLRKRLATMQGGATGATTRTVSKLLSPNAQGKVRWALQDEADPMIKSLDNEQDMHNSSTGGQGILGNSRTAQRLTNRELWNSPQGQVSDTIDKLKNWVRHPFGETAGAALDYVSRGWDAKKAAYAAKVRDDAARLLTLQGPLRDSIYQWILEHGENYGATPTPVEQPIPQHAAGGAVQHFDDGGPVGPPSGDAMPPQAMLPTPGHPHVLDPMAPGLLLLNAPGAAAGLANKAYNTPAPKLPPSSMIEEATPARNAEEAQAPIEPATSAAEPHFKDLNTPTPWEVAQPIMAANADKGLQHPPEEAADRVRLGAQRVQKAQKAGDQVDANSLPGAPSNDRTVIRAPEAKEGEQQLPDFITGKLTPEDWVARQEAIMTPDQIREASQWYNNLRGEFLKQTNGNEALANKYMRAWLVAQQNIGVAPAMSNVLLQAEQFARGVPLDQMRAGGMPNPTAAARSVLQNQPIEGGVGAKISDFVDAAEGKPVRSWMGNHPDGGAPFVVDVHSGRDTGLVDQTLKNHLERLGYDKNDIDKLKVDLSGGGVKGTQYESRSQFGREVTNHLNDIGWQGRFDWTPAEVQAVGWMGMTRLTRDQADDVTTALSRNVRNISMELSLGEGSPWAQKYGEDFASLSPQDQRSITHDITNEAINHAARISGIDPGTIINGTGAWMQYQNPSTVAQAFATKQGAEIAANTLGRLLHQTEVWSNSVKPVTISPKGFAVDFVANGNHTLNSDAGLRSFWERVMDADPMKGTKTPLFQGYQPIISRDGMPGIRVLIDRGGQKTADALQRAVGPGGSVSSMIENMSGTEGQSISTQLHEAEISKHRNDWSKDTNGEAYTQRLVNSLGRDPTADLSNAGGQLEARLKAAIDAAKGRGQEGQVAPQQARGGAVRGEQQVNSSTANINQSRATANSAFARGGAVKHNDPQDEIPGRTANKNDHGQDKHWCKLCEDTKHDVVSGADSTNRRTLIDRHIPKFSPTLKDKHGQPANLHKYLDRHEKAEAIGMKRDRMSYAEAHAKRGIPAERSAVLGDGVNWKAYNEEMAGYLSHVEHEKVTKPPVKKGLHVDPNKAIHTKSYAAGGRVGFHPEAIGARKAKDGYWYLPDPERPNKFLMVRVKAHV